MSDTTFVYRTTHIAFDWLNDVNVTVYRVLGALGVAPTTVTALLSNLGLPVTAAAFGFKASGTAAANKTALQNAINSFVSTTTGGELYIRAGAYSVTPGLTLVNNLTIRGAGAADVYGEQTGGTRLVFASAGTAFTLSDNAAGAGQNSKLKDMYILGAGGGTVGVEMNSTTHLENVTVDGFSSYNIWMRYNINMATIRDCSAINGGSHGLNVGNTSTDVSNTIFEVSGLKSRANTGTGIYINNGINYTFRNCLSESNSGSGLAINKPAGVTNGKGHFDGCWFEANGTGAGSYQITFTADTHTPAGAPSFFRFTNCHVNGTGALDNLHVVDGAHILFDWDSQFSATGNTVLETNANYVGIYNGTNMTDNGNRNWTGKDGTGTNELGGPSYSAINVISMTLGTGAFNVGEWQTPGFAAGSYTTNGAGGWTVASPNITTMQAVTVKKLMTVNFAIGGTTVTAATGTQLKIAIPFSATAAKTVRTQIGVVDNGGTRAVGTAEVLAGGTVINCYVNAGLATNWTAAAAATGMDGSITFEIQ